MLNKSLLFISVCVLFVESSVQGKQISICLTYNYTVDVADFQIRDSKGTHNLHAINPKTYVVILFDSEQLGFKEPTREAKVGH